MSEYHLGELARIFGVSCNTISRWMESGKMQHHVNERKQRYCTEEDLMQFMNPAGKLDYDAKDEYTRNEMTKILNCSEKTIRRLDEKGILHPKKKSNGRCYYTMQDIRDYESFLTKKPVENVPQIYTRKNIAKILSCSERTIIRLEQAGILNPEITPTGRHHYSMQDINDYISYLERNEKYSHKLSQIKEHVNNYFSDKNAQPDSNKNKHDIKKDIYTIRELTSKYRISDKTVYEWAKQGILIREKNGYRLNGDVEYDKTDKKNL